MTRKTRGLAAATVLVAAIAVGWVIVTSSAPPATPAAQESPPTTASVEQGTLAAMVSLDGTLTYRARSDGTPYVVINQGPGTYTQLPDAGDRVACGGVLYRVDDNPVMLLCGTVPAYRSLSEGDHGPDVTQLNANLVDLGYATPVELDRSSAFFGSETVSALEKLQSTLGEDLSGSLDLGRAVFLPESVRIGQVTGVLGGPAAPGAQVALATSDIPEVQVDLDPSQQSEVKAGQPAQVTLPDNSVVTGKVDRLGSIAQVPAGQNAGAGNATIPASMSLDDPAATTGLDSAPVQVDITTEGVENALSVPVTALVGKSGGGFAVEVVRTDGGRVLVAVKLGLFDTAGGRVQVDGDLAAGDQVVVPSS